MRASPSVHGSLREKKGENGFGATGPFSGCPADGRRGGGGCVCVVCAQQPVHAVDHRVVEWLAGCRCRSNVARRRRRGEVSKKRRFVRGEVSKKRRFVPGEREREASGAEWIVSRTGCHGSLAFAYPVDSTRTRFPRSDPGGAARGGKGVWLDRGGNDQSGRLHLFGSLACRTWYLKRTVGCR